MTHARNQDGFALIEVIVSAAVLAIVALAVLSGIDGATASTARERARAVAATLAEQEHERLRSFRFDELSKLVGVPAGDAARTQTKTIDGVSYTVDTEVGFVVDSGSPTATCGATGKAQNEYIKVVTTVTSAIAGTRINPVKLESLVAPPVSGSLVVKVVSATENPVVGVGVTARAKSGRSYQGTTNGDGCALFVAIESGEYTVTLEKAGYVDRVGNKTAESITTVSPNLVNVLTLSYDVAADITVHVKTLRPDTAWSAGAPSYPSVAAAVSDNSADPNTLRTYTPAQPASTIEVDDVFPFPTGYSFFTGACAIQSPVKVYNGNYFSQTNPDAVVVADPLSRKTATVFQPALNLRVRSNSDVSSTYKVYVHLQSKDECPDLQGKRLAIKSWPTSEWGAAPDNNTRNWIVQDVPGFDAGLPFGVYKVCLQNGSGNWWSTGMNGTSHYDNTKPATTTTTQIPPTNATWTSKSGAGC